MIHDPLTDLQSRYVYTRDTRDRWTLLSAPTGPLHGDCEDWAYTALWLCAAQSWRRFWGMIWRREASLWWTRFHGTGGPHVMLFVRGRGWTDSYYPGWSDHPKHPELRRYGVIKLALTLILKRERKQNVQG